jgi:signal transduction histidine kinase
MRGPLVAVLAAVIGLAGGLLATLFLFASANAAIDRVLDERLRGAGESAALLLGQPQVGSHRLAELMRNNALDGAYLLSPDLVIVEDAAGNAGAKADLLRVDPDRVRRAFAGEASVGSTYEVGPLSVAAGYFPLRGPDGAVRSVLALEAGRAFMQPRTDLARARTAGVLLSVLSALALGLLAARWITAERARGAQAERAARSEAVARMAAMVAHEIRNPLSVIRGTVELMRERSAAGLAPRDAEALRDVLAEVERMRRLTEDFLDLGSERPLTRAPVDVLELAREAARAAEAAHPGLRVSVVAAQLPPLEGDASRLRQVLANLLANAAQAQREGEIEVRARASEGGLRIRVRDFGPGVPWEQRARLFDPFFTTKSGGTGLGLAIARRLCERHGGSLALLNEPGPGAVFEITLPV